MSSDDPESDREDVHRGHDLESGLLARVREWTDVFPWLRLGRTLRVAASPPMVLGTAIVFLVWWFGAVRILGNETPRSMDSLRATSLTPPRLWLGVAWSIFVWAPVALFLTRQGALLTAGRTLVGLKPGVSHSIQRTPAAWIAAVVPPACVMAIGLLILVIGWLARIIAGVVVLEWLLAIAVVLIAIPCGMLAFGAMVAVPLSWAALSNERDPDALDSLSRGYEALFRRPLRLALYIIVSLGILAVVALLAMGVALAASMVATLILTMSGCSPTVPLITENVLHYFPWVVVVTLGWSLVGGIYLLLRYDTGGQEVEDLWQPTPPPKPPLPQIPL